jgi:pentafunctional AROM polypeptide
LKKPETYGGSVTIPHKQAVMPLLDSLSEDAQQIKAVNTVVKVNDKLEGHNTDWWAIYALTEQSLLRAKKSKENLLALVVGAGGTAHAACYALQRLAIPFRIWNRTADKAKELALQFGGEQVNSVETLEVI